jgi:hypothetical protein
MAAERTGFHSIHRGLCTLGAWGGIQALTTAKGAIDGLSRCLIYCGARLSRRAAVECHMEWSR